MPTLVHIFNPVDTNPNTELGKAQPVVMKSLVQAAHYNPSVKTEILATKFAHDRISIPEGIRVASDLTRSVNDFIDLKQKRELPLMRDIITKALTESDAEYIIYSNADIAVLPFFYEVVAEYLKMGYDGLIINRRRIQVGEVLPDKISMLYAKAGKPHSGYDCFVFHRSVAEKFIFHNTCIGVPPAGTDLAHNLFAFSTRLALLTEQHLTFHLGMDLVRKWGDTDLIRYNKGEFKKMLRELKPHFSIERIPGSGLPFFRRHFKWLMNPAFSYPLFARLDFKQWNTPRPTYPKKWQVRDKKYYEWLNRTINYDETV